MHKLFKVAALVFFALGIVFVPIWTWGGTEEAEFFKLGIYLVAAVVFWLWFYQDAIAHHIPRHWLLLVGLFALIAAIPVVPIYLLITRGWKSGSIATFGFFGVVLGLFAMVGVGAFVASELMNSLHLTSNFPVHPDLAHKAAPVR